VWVFSSSSSKQHNPNIPYSLPPPSAPPHILPLLSTHLLSPDHFLFWFFSLSLSLSIWETEVEGMICIYLFYYFSVGETKRKRKGGMNVIEYLYGDWPTDYTREEQVFLFPPSLYVCNGVDVSELNKSGKQVAPKSRAIEFWLLATSRLQIDAL
jgi:hypothetical protein